MVGIPVFEVERWMDDHETKPDVLNIAETCAASVSLNELATLAGDDAKREFVDPSMTLLYGTIRGTKELRGKVATLLGTNAFGSNDLLDVDDILITQGAISANFHLLYTLLGPGDHVVCVYPTYQQLYTVPASIGAEVSLWRLEASNNFVPDVRELEKLTRPNTKVVVPRVF